MTKRRAVEPVMATIASHTASLADPSRNRLNAGAPSGVVI
jgi:hypothetical protein